MKVLEKSGRGETVKVRVEGEEDLWTLKTLLRPGDVVGARTYREVSMGGRGPKERRPLFLKVRVKNVEFQPFTGKLRIFGVIVEGPEEYGLKGKHHSIVIGPGQTIVLERPGGWNRKDLSRMEESGPRGRAIIAAVDYDEYGIALLAPYGFKILVEESMRLPGKDDPSREQELESRLARIARLIIDYAKANDAGVVVIVGPGQLKAIVADRVRREAPSLRVVVDDASMGGRHGSEEALRRTTVSQALREYTIMEAEDAIGEFLSAAAREPERVAMGPGEVLAVARMGAVEKLVVLDSMIHSIDDNEREMVDEALASAEMYRGKVIIIPEDSPPGEQVKRLGGIIAVLRYPVPMQSRRISE